MDAPQHGMALGHGVRFGYEGPYFDKQGVFF
jgi:hypothetical protein